jgi:hypothetical protein
MFDAEWFKQFSEEELELGWWFKTTQELVHDVASGVDFLFVDSALLREQF